MHVVGRFLSAALAQPYGRPDVRNSMHFEASRNTRGALVADTFGVSRGDQSTPSRVGPCQCHSHGPAWRDSPLSTLSLAFPGASPGSGLRMRLFPSPDQLPPSNIISIRGLDRKQPLVLVKEIVLLGQRPRGQWIKPKLPWITIIRPDGAKNDHLYETR
ncbi:hypothetical protein BDP81DRAFT_186753 [Colletotrichum phormii]|uniref:Uncharacterized protein n=1 Tax=Colletotrichum phormii TaxID=359342 RepID=A0AAI9ZBQ3_9PEZI|nr:uncharacterized protein BDP81DRAFT_186753 [Colletotrichum phormii]KAK1621476.1 hypothetical protein BDP81DRAFT_186753 [Colletotrichum phormii]